MKAYQRTTVLLIMAFAMIFASRQGGNKPVEKVVKMIKDLQDTIKEEDKEAKEQYEKDANNCKDDTETKSDKIKQHNTDIGKLASTIQEDQATLKSKRAELTDTVQQGIRLQGQREAQATQCKKEEGSLRKHIHKMKVAKQNLKDAMGEMAGHEDNSADASDHAYKEHSGSIIKTLERVDESVADQKDGAEAMLEKCLEDCEKADKDYEQQLSDNDDTQTSLKEDIAKLETDMGTNQEDLLKEEEGLRAVTAELKELTTSCEDMAKVWDQVSSLRAGELKALKGALEYLEGDVTDMDKVNKRSFLSTQKQTLSFLQRKSSNRAKAIAVLSQEGQRLNSKVLRDLSAKANGDALKKVEAMVRNLRDRIMQEIAQEKDKKGFCDTTITKNNALRNTSFEDVETAAADHTSLEARKEKLDERLEEIRNDEDGELKTERDELAEAEEEREDDHKVNTETLADARTGLKALMNAMKILEDFYRKSARATVDGGRGDTAYTGKQGSSEGIIGMLETIKADFELTIKDTESAENEAQRTFVEEKRTKLSTVQALQTEAQHTVDELAKTTQRLHEAKKDMENAQLAVDTASKQIEDLKPTCMETGGTYKERQEHREKELKALDKACEFLGDGEKAC